MLSLSPLDVLDEIWDLIESVSEGFPTYVYSYVSEMIHLWLNTLPCKLNHKVSDEPKQTKDEGLSTTN